MEELLDIDLADLLLEHREPWSYNPNVTEQTTRSRHDNQSSRSTCTPLIVEINDQGTIQWWRDDYYLQVGQDWPNPLTGRLCYGGKKDKTDALHYHSLCNLVGTIYDIRVKGWDSATISQPHRPRTPNPKSVCSLQGSSSNNISNHNSTKHPPHQSQS